MTAPRINNKVILNGNYIESDRRLKKREEIKRKEETINSVTNIHKEENYII